MQDLAFRSMSSFFPEILGVSGTVLVMELGGSPITKPHRDLMTALGVLHNAGVVHLDLKPVNILEDVEGRAGQSGSILSWIPLSAVN